MIYNTITKDYSLTTFDTLSEKNYLVKKEDENYFRPSDLSKISRVTEWIQVHNPVVATCRRCGYRGLIDNPVIGLYAEGLKLRNTAVSLYYDHPLISSEKKHEPIIRPDDYLKLSKVKTWIDIDNPVYGTCRHCGHRGLCDCPTVGLY